MKTLATLLLLLALLSPSLASEKDALTLQRRAMHEIFLGDDKKLGECTATAISPHALLTADHCINDLEDEWKQWVDPPDTPHRSDTSPYSVERVEEDGADHVILLVTGPMFTATVPYSAALPVIGEQVHWVGCPDGLRGLYREGAVVGPLAAQADADIMQPVWVVQAPAIPGDSGSAVWDEDGHLVGIVSYTMPGAMMGMYRMQFSDEQIAAANSFGGK